jgi:hypothetical protein
VPQQQDAQRCGLLLAAAHELDEALLDRGRVLADDGQQGVEIGPTQLEALARLGVAHGVEQGQVGRQHGIGLTWLRDGPLEVADAHAVPAVELQGGARGRQSGVTVGVGHGAGLGAGTGALTGARRDHPFGLLPVGGVSHYAAMCRSSAQVVVARSACGNGSRSFCPVRTRRGPVRRLPDEASGDLVLLPLGGLPLAAQVDHHVAVLARDDGPQALVGVELTPERGCLRDSTTELAVEPGVLLVRLRPGTRRACGRRRPGRAARRLLRPCGR